MRDCNRGKFALSIVSGCAYVWNVVIAPARDKIKMDVGPAIWILNMVWSGGGEPKDRPGTC